MMEKPRAVVGLVAATVRHERARTVLAVLGVALAVLATTLLGSVGYGVVETGQEKFDSSGRDLWVTGGPVRIAPGGLGGFQSQLVDAHGVAGNITAREDVQTAVPLSFQTVYAGTDPDDVETYLAVGVPGAGGSSVQVTEGQGFTRGGAVHYAGGTYSGNFTHEAMVDPRTRASLNASVNGTLYVGGTVLGAADHPYEVVGITPTFSRFLGAPTVVVPLSELQTMTGAARADRATMITVDLVDSADPAAVATELEAEYPSLQVRTNQEQLQSVVAQRALVVVAGGALVVLAVLGGLALTVNLLSLHVYQQRRTLAAVRATGISARTLVGIVAGQGVVIGAFGGLLGVALTPPAATALNAVAYRVVGFEGLVQTPEWALIAGAGIALVIGTLSAAAAGWRVARSDPLAALR
jgi:putative ABC transport system permease protein